MEWGVGIFLNLVKFRCATLISWSTNGTWTLNESFKSDLLSCVGSLWYATILCIRLRVFILGVYIRRRAYGTDWLTDWLDWCCGGRLSVSSFHLWVGVFDFNSIWCIALLYARVENKIDDHLFLCCATNCCAFPVPYPILRPIDWLTHSLNLSDRLTGRPTDDGTGWSVGRSSVCLHGTILRQSCFWKHFIRLSPPPSPASSSSLSGGSVGAAPSSVLSARPFAVSPRCPIAGRFLHPLFSTWEYTRFNLIRHVSLLSLSIPPPYF